MVVIIDSRKWEHWYQLLHSVLFRRFGGKRKQENIKKTKVEQQPGIPQYMNLLLKVITIARLNDDACQPTERDYIKTLSKFAGVAALTSFTAFLALGVSLYVMQGVLTALNSMQIISFQFWLTLFVVGNFYVHIQSYLAQWLGVEVKQEMCTQFQDYLDKKFIEQGREVNYPENETAYFESIKVVSDMFPTLVKKSAMVLGYGAYAIFNFSPSLLIVSAILGIVVGKINRDTSLDLRKANTEEIKTSQEARALHKRLYNSIAYIRDINAEQVFLSLKKNKTKALKRATVNLALAEKKQALFANLTEVVTLAVFYLYFAAGLSVGYMTVLDVIILTPFMKEIGKCASMSVGIRAMLSSTGKNINNIKTVWNELVPNHQITEDETPVEITTLHIMVYLVAIDILLFVVHAYFPYNFINGVSLFLTMLLISAACFPDSTGARLFGYTVKVMEYPFRRLMGQSEEVVRVREKKVGEDPYVFNNKLQYRKKSYQIKFDVSQHPVMQVIGRNNVGKTVTFRYWVPGKMNKVPGAYLKEESICVTGSPVLLVSKGRYIDSLAGTFYDQGLPEINDYTETLGEYIDGACKTIGVKLIGAEQKNSMYEPVESAHFSNGTKQLIHTLAALYKAIQKQYKYMCIDEGLVGLSTGDNVCKQAYEFIIKECRTNDINLAIVHHGQALYEQINGVKKVEVAESKKEVSVRLAKT